MPQRNSQRTPAQLRSGPSLITQGLGRVAAQSQQGLFDTHVSAEQVIPVAESRQGGSPLLQNVLGSLEQFTQNAVERTRQTAFLEGAAAAGLGQSEASLQTHPLTRGWSIAGHRDATGSIALAEYETKIATNMPTLREQGPEALRAFLTKQRNEVMGTVGAMTAEGREKALAQLLTIDRAAISKHNVEHSKFIVEQIQQAKSVRLTTGLDNLNSAKGTPAYESARDSLFAAAISEIQLDPHLDKSAKDDLTVEFLTAALNDGHLGMYELFRQYPVLPDGNGGHFSVSQLLGFEKQQEVFNAYKSAQSYHANAAGMDMWQTLTDMEIAAKNGQYVSVDTYQSHLQDMVSARFLDNSQYNSRMKSFSASKRDADNAHITAQAYVTGNVDLMVGLGTSFQKAGEAAEAIWAQHGATATDVLHRHLAVGVNTGNDWSFKRAGELMRPSITALMSTEVEEISPEQTAIVQSVNDAFLNADAQGRDDLQYQLLRSLDNEQKGFISNVFTLMRHGETAQDAVTKAKATHLKGTQLSPAARQEVSRQQTAINKEILDKATSETNWWNLGGKVAGIFPGTESSILSPIRPEGGGSGAIPYERAAIRDAMDQELSAFDAAGILYESPKSKMAAAAANVAERTVPVPTERGVLGRRSNLILPIGTDIKSFFLEGEALAEVGDSYGVSHFGQALGQLTEREGEYPVYEVSNGNIVVTYYNDRGDSTPIGTDIIDPKDVGRAAMLIRDNNNQKAVEVHGPGKVVRGTQGATAQFNGDNTAGVANADAFYVRQTLVDMEDIRDTVYKDTNGKLTVGIGIAETGPWFPEGLKEGDVVDKAVIDKTFRDASDYFIGKAVDFISASPYPLNSSPELLALTTHISYQSGEGNARKDLPPMFEAISRGDLGTAMKALQNSAAYKAAGNTRRIFYVETLNKLFK